MRASGWFITRLLHPDDVMAAPRNDGRVREITRNMNFEGLTHLRMSYQPQRDHTRDMMLEAMEYV